MARPRAVAVFRLMKNSNFIGCFTGKSAGFAPFILSRTPYSRRQANMFHCRQQDWRPGLAGFSGYAAGLVRSVAGGDLRLERGAGKFAARAVLSVLSARLAGWCHGRTGSYRPAWAFQQTMGAGDGPHKPGFWQDGDAAQARVAVPVLAENTVRLRQIMPSLWPS